MSSVSVTLKVSFLLYALIASQKNADAAENKSNQKRQHYELVQNIKQEIVTVDFDESALRMESHQVGYVLVAHAPSWKTCIFNPRTKERYDGQNLHVPLSSGEPAPILPPPLKSRKSQENGLKAISIDSGEAADSAGSLTRVFFRDHSLDAKKQIITHYTYTVWDKPLPPRVVEIAQQIFKVPQNKNYPLSLAGFHPLSSVPSFKLRTISACQKTGPIDTSVPAKLKVVASMAPIMLGQPSDCFDEMTQMYQIPGQ